MAVYPERRKGRLTGKWIAEAPLYGKRKRDRFDTKKEADQWEGILKLTGELPTLAAPVEDHGPTFGQVARDLLAAKPDMDPSSRDRLMYVIDFVGEHTPIKDVGTTKLDELVKDLRKRPGKQGGKLSLGTINRYLSAASAVFHYARTRKVLAVSPVVPWQEDEGERLHWLTEEQERNILRLLEEQGEYDCALTTRVLTETGMRWGEFASLKAEQVEPDTGWIRLWKTKNNKARSVPVSRSTALELKRMITAGRVPNYYTFRNRLQAAAKSAGQPDGFSIHALRHTTATRLIQKEVPLPIVQKYLGHKTIQTTLKYVHVADGDLQEALEKISPHAGQSPKTGKSRAA